MKTIQSWIQGKRASEEHKQVLIKLNSTPAPTTSKTSKQQHDIPIQASPTTLTSSLAKLKNGYIINGITVRNNECPQIESLLLKEQFTLQNIKFLQLTNIGLTSFPSQLTSRMENLAELNLDSNMIRELPDDIDQVIKSQSLSFLQISGNLLQTLPASVVTLFERGLKQFHVQENYIKLDELPQVLKSRGFSTNRVWHSQLVSQQIIPKVYLGSVQAAKNKEHLLDAGITHVLSVCVMNEVFPGEFQYKIIKEEDQRKTNIIQHFDQCFEFIESAIQSEGSVLVHCAAGQSRSATIVIAYLMHKLKLSFEEAFEHVFERRCCIAPNDGFIQQLELFDGIGQTYEGVQYQQFIQNAIESSKPKSYLSLNYLRLSSVPDSLEHEWKTVDLSYNFLTDITPLARCNFSTLVNLDLSHNNIGNIPVDVCLNLRTVQVLALNYNQIEEIPSELFANTPVLRQLHLSNNKLTTIPEDVIVWRDHLTHLDLASNRLFELPDSLRQFSKLKAITLACNCFAQEPAVLSELKSEYRTLVTFVPASQKSTTQGE